LIADDNAGVMPSLAHEFGVQPTEVGCVAGKQCALPVRRPNQLFIVRIPQQILLPAGEHIPTATQSIQEGVGIGVFIQMKA
jgi:hypothetical protein